MLLRAIFSSGTKLQSSSSTFRIGSTTTTTRVLQIARLSLFRVSDEIRSIFQRDRPQLEKQRMLDDLMSGEKTKLFNLRDIATILQSSSKSGVRIKDVKKLVAELRKSNEK